MQVFPVGCMEGQSALYVHVAAPSKQDAEDYVSKNRPEVTVISVFDSAENVETDKPMTVRLTKSI